VSHPVLLISQVNSIVIDLKIDNLAYHTEYLRRVVPPDRLFFVSVKDGWAPICKILDIPIPDEPFPHANDKYEIQRAVEKLVKKAVLRWLMLFAILAALLAIGSRLYL
jgi:hypothetical protein